MSPQKFPSPTSPAGPSQLGHIQPIVTQPLPDPRWINMMPKGEVNCPPGLEYLTKIDQLLVQKEIVVEIVSTPFTMGYSKYKFAIKNSIGQTIYYSAVNHWINPREKQSKWPIDMTILDNHQTQVIHFSHSCQCHCCSSRCCLQIMNVSSPPGQLVGTVQDESGICKSAYTIRTPADRIVLRIKGPRCPRCISGRNVEFEVMSADGIHQVGKVSKQWSGMKKELFDYMGNYEITFPMDLDVKMKAVMLGACYWIDHIMYN